MDTIFAEATAPGRAGLSVIRLSGPRAWSATERLVGRLPPPREARVRALRGADGGLIDRALVLLFPEGESFTGEAVAELHVHGSRAVVRRLLEELGALEGLRLAEPGEFTGRAMMNDRLDLPQVEGLADLLAAETEAQRLQAMKAVEGDLARRIEGWRGRLLRALALVEASIDFADEEVPEEVPEEVTGLIDGLARDFRAEIAGSETAERLREGFEVAIVGRPNAGKSTLLNALSGREAAITSEMAGTTRDVIEVRMDLGGLPVTFLDTAGLRATDDAVEAIGVERARQRAEKADLRIFLIDEEGLPDLLSPREGDLLVHGKADLRPEVPAPRVSGRTGEGIGALMEETRARLAERVETVGVATRARHAAALRRALQALETARAGLEEGAGGELVAEDLRAVGRALDRLIGRIGVEDVLGEIFASFCIGK